MIKCLFPSFFLHPSSSLCQLPPFFFLCFPYLSPSLLSSFFPSFFFQASSPPVSSLLPSWFSSRIVSVFKSFSPFPSLLTLAYFLSFIPSLHFPSLSYIFPKYFLFLSLYLCLDSLLSFSFHEPLPFASFLHSFLSWHKILPSPSPQISPSTCEKTPETIYSHRGERTIRLYRKNFMMSSPTHCALASRPPFSTNSWTLNPQTSTSTSTLYLLPPFAHRSLSHLIRPPARNKHIITSRPTGGDGKRLPGSL